MKVALQASEIFGVKRDCLHLDSSSFHVHGAYLRKETIDPEGKVLEEPITITHGYSRDHRPDLKQFIVNLMCSGDRDVPLYLKVADAALYSVDNIESLANLKWVSRVPATIKDTSHNFIFVKGLTKTQLINPNTFVHCNLKKMLLRMSYIKINYKKF